MKNSIQTLRKDEQGFTLVELAVVMVIIGVLIGGILKGQELITNARVTSTISQFEAISAAKNDFQNQYNAIPGDMSNAETRLANCGIAPNLACSNGDGNGRLDTVVGAAVGANEGLGFYGMLLAADYITGMTGDTASGFALGTSIPLAPVGGGFYAGDTNAGAAATFPTLRPGLYITLVGSTGAVSATNGLVTGVQAFRMDTKLDDGSGTTGTFFGNVATECQDNAGVYSGDIESVCSLAYRI